MTDEDFLRAKNIILKYIEKYSNLPKQGTQKWLEQRKTSIGGSEVAAIIGENKYQNMFDVIEDKIGLREFIGNNATRWGNIFENISELLINKLFSTVYSLGSIENNDYPIHKYSPDGITIILINNKYKIILLEFKSPFRRIPNKYIPKAYKPQVLSGLCTIDICEQGLYVDNMYRLCSKEQLGFNGMYSNKMGYRDNDMFNNCICYGINFFSIKRDKINSIKSLLIEKKCNYINIQEEEIFLPEILESNQDDEYEFLSKFYRYTAKKIGLDLKEDIIDILDIGLEDNSMLDDFLELHSTRLLNSRYYILGFNTEPNFEDWNLPENLSYCGTKEYIKSKFTNYNIDATIKKYMILCKKNNEIPFIMMPWKMFKSSFILLDKDENFIKTHIHKFNETMEISDKINKLDTSDKKRIALDKYKKNYLSRY